MGFLDKLLGRTRVAVVVLRPGRGWTVEVVGESQYQDALASAYRRHGGDGHDLKVTAALVPEGGNAQDPQAVRVEIDGKPVGYLPREVAPDYRASMGDVVGTCSAKIVGGFERDDGSQAFFGVKLNAKWPPVAD